MFNFLLLILGTALIALGIYVEIHHRLIWDSSIKAQKAKKSRKKKTTLQKMNEPSELAYKLNIYLVWPLVILVGSTLIVFALAGIATEV